MTLRLVVRPGFQAERWIELSAALDVYICISLSFEIRILCKLVRIEFIFWDLGL